MSEVVSALGGVSCDATVRIAEIGPQGMIALRGDLADPRIKNAATGIAGVDMPSALTATCVGDRGICWMSPDELLVLCPYGEVAGNLQQIAATLGDAHALAVDMSDARASFQLRGARVREVLAKLTPADVSETALPPGRFRRTRLAQVSGAFWLRDAQTAQIICFRSVATYVFDLLCTAAAPGSEVD